jgi:hypothetical protein
VLAACVLLLAACEDGGSQAVKPSPSPAGAAMEAKPGLAVPLAEVVFQGGFKPRWVEDAGWGEREVKGPGPAKVKMADLGGWVLRSEKPLKPGFGGLAFRYKAPSDFGDFLEVRLESGEEAPFPRVQVSSRHVVGMDGDWVQLLLPMAELNPERRPFDRFVIRAHKRVDPEWVELDRIGFTLPGVGLSEEAPRGASMALVETAFDRGLKTGWMVEGWSERQVEGMAPAKVMMAQKGGWTLRYKEPLTQRFAALSFRYKAPSEYGEFLEVRLDSGDKVVFPRVMLGMQHRVDRDGDWLQVLVPMGELNPQGHPFDRVVMRAHKNVGSEWVQLDRIGFTSMAAAQTGMAAEGMVRVAVGPPRPASLSVDCTGPGQAISPLIYGIAFDPLKEGRSSHQFEMGATVRRWGGNPTSRYNWKINAWNTANDWFFRNVSPGDRPDFTYEEFFQANRQHGLQSALTLPMLGWVAKDTSSVSFPVSKVGAQEKVDPEVPEAGNGKSPTGRELAAPMPTRTSEPAPPEFIAEWVRAIRKKDAERGRSVQMYFLDNEPMLWNSTHRDVHPEPTTYDELLERTLSYGTAVRQADPEAVIAGPTEWGWTGYFRSAADVAPGMEKDGDRKKHGNVPLLPWYLKKLREHEKKTGTRILDVVDVHFYPQADGVSPDKGEKTDPETSALRLRSTRALWDPNYKDESWIGEPVRLIPRLKKMVEENYPGRGIAIGEYNFGAAQHMSGGLAQAEVLGRFAEGGVTAAYYFTYPPQRSPAWWAFRAYRNFDGEGGRFQDVYVPSKAEEGTSLFASRSADGRRMVAIALNVSPETARDARVELKGCGALQAAKVMTYAGEATGFAEQQARSMGAGGVGAQLPPYSITVLDLMLEPAKAAGKPSPVQGRRPASP